MASPASVPTVNVTQEAIDGFIYAFSIYAILGGILMCANIPLVIVILFHKILRTQKEFVIIGGLAFADALQGIALFLSGAGRIIAINDNTAFILTTRWSCFVKIWNLVYYFSMPMSSSMLTIVSIDRLYAVFYPLRYFALTSHYAVRMVFTLYALVTIGVIINAILSYSSSGELLYPTYCFTKHGEHPLFFQYYDIIVRAAMPFISVLLYIVVWARLRKKFSIVRHGEQGLAHKMKRMRRITGTLAVCCVCTLMLNSLPLFYGYFFVKLGAPTWATLDQDIFVANNVNPVLNVFIYLYRQREIRGGFKILLMGKQLNPNANVINANN
uniref:G-protein coupled receptors family 1 profile domain-containing protein n=1 Tax=Plectus sambesii TaxID=2011161 RepID=A0A914WJ63_9BILA